MTIYPIGEMTRIAELFGEFGITFAALLVVLVIGVDLVDDLLERKAGNPALPTRHAEAN